jgi:LuxR family transcriptional regulator, maltose regulon positive regulatory protein
LLPPGTALAWIAADEDDDLHRFLRSLFAALEPYDLPWRIAPEALIAAATDARGDRRGAATGLLNALAACEVPRGLIVVDDAHRIPDPAVFELLTLVVERLPAHWGLVICSRVEPPLPLARLRAQDELAELRQAELCFSREEVASLADKNGSTADAGQLLARTGGWAAGLRLTLNAQRPGPSPHGMRAMDRHVFDFLAAEVLDDMPAELREFLLRCSVLPQLTAGHCAAVSGTPRAAELLAEIERRGLFVSVLDGPELVLTLHELFRAFLDERLHREQPELLPELLRRAADAEPDPIRRLSYLLRAGAWEAAELALEAAAEPLLADGAVDPVLRLIEQFPAEWRASSPMLALIRGQTAWERWDWRSMAQEMRRAAQGFALHGDDVRGCRVQVFEAIALFGDGAVPDSKARLAALDLRGADVETHALALALNTWSAFDDQQFHRVPAGYNAALELLEQTDRLRIWCHCFQRTLYVWVPGMAAPLARLVAGVLRCTGDTPTQMRAIAHVMSAWMALWRGDLQQAVHWVDQADSDARWLGMPVRLHMFLSNVRAAVHAVRGERDAALRAISESLGYFETAPVSGPLEQPTSMLGHYLFFAVRLADALGDDQALREYAARLPPQRRIKNFHMLRTPLATLPARLATLEGRHAEAAGIWAKVLENESALEVMGLAEEARLRHADALLRLGRKAEAAATLQPLLRRVADSGELGGVLLAGSAVLSRVAAAAWRDELDWTELAMLRGWAQRYGRPSDEPMPAACVCSLSPREMEVLAHIAAGDSNKRIARDLELSPHTVKRHVANILDKLELSSRSEAARWYRANC